MPLEEPEKLDGLIRTGLEYLERELGRVTQEDGNAAEAIRILKFLSEHRARVNQEAVSVHGEAALAADRERFDLTGDMGAG